jgi:hypothetical protein
MNMDPNPNLNRKNIHIDIEVTIEIESVFGAWERRKKRHGAGSHGLAKKGLKIWPNLMRSR